MNPVQITPERCQMCPLPEGYEAKPLPTHKYGDYVVLKPDQASAQRLEKLAHSIANMIVEQAPSLQDGLRKFTSDAMHLTLAMPLVPMSKVQVGELIRKISAKAPGSLNFDLIFRNPDSGGTAAFCFSAPNYAPGFDVRLQAPKTSYNGHNANNPHLMMETLARSIQKYCKKNELVDTERNNNGECNNFNPHFTLGKLSNSADGKVLHDRNAHASQLTSLRHLASVKAAEIFKCDQKHRHCDLLPICFESVEILRCDSNGDDSNVTSLLASYNLKTGTTSIAPQFPGCMHK